MREILISKKTSSDNLWTFPKDPHIIHTITDLSVDEYS